MPRFSRAPVPGTAGMLAALMPQRYVPVAASGSCHPPRADAHLTRERTVRLERPAVTFDKPVRVQAFPERRRLRRRRWV
ncbi:hypothetical protein GALL_392210 [mine drainage metagenome]|uniref:Uncharacterized protein n=1 Tax=mine drainage metagenome TaxID=410659 RepID=A0A1J5QT24_9ZZZZ